MSVTHKPKAGATLTGTEYEAADAHVVSIAHTELTGVTTDQHHAEVHAIGGADHSGTLAHSALSSVTADQHHAEVHSITGADHSGFPGGTSTFLRADATFATPTASVSFTAFTQDLGVAHRSGTFDLTGLAGLTADKTVQVMQTAAKITSKGDARDEPEMDQIQVTGYVVDAATIRCYWQAPSVVVGTYAFAYLVGA